MAEGDINAQQPLPASVLQSMIPGLLGGIPPAQTPIPAAPQSSPQIPQQTPSAIPPTTPFDLASMVKQVSALPEYQQASGRLEDIGRQEQGIQQQMQSMMPPPMGFHPNIVHGEGVGGFFHNLGQALLTILASTRPGQEVQNTIYGPGIRKYTAQKQSLADQLAALKEQETIPTEELRATTGLTQAAGLAGYRGAMAQATTDRVKAYAQSIQDRAQNYVATQDWRAATLDEKKRANLINEAQKAADEAGRNFRSLHKDATTEEVAQIVTGTKEQIANEAAARDPGVKSWLFNALGISVPQVQGAPSPEFRPTPKAGEGATTPKTPAKPKAGGQQFHYDKNGNRVQGP